LKYPAFKDLDYNQLIFKYWREYDNWNGETDFGNTQYLTQCDSIQRAKRKLVEANPQTFGGIDLQKASYRLDKEARMIEYARN